MYQQIEKLKTEKQKLTVEYKNNQTEFKGEINRINKAIRSFEKGMNELNGSTQPKRRKMMVEIENILAGGALHVKEILARLHQAGFTNLHYQSISGILQTYAKAGKKFVKTAPATFGLLEQKIEGEVNNESQAEIKKVVNKPIRNDLNNNKAIQTIVYEEPIDGGDNELDQIF